MKRRGGYLLNDLMNGRELVRRGNPQTKTGRRADPLFEPHPERWMAVITEMVELSQTLYDRQIKVDKFVPIVILDLPPKPPDIATNEETEEVLQPQKCTGTRYQRTSVQKSSPNEDDSRSGPILQRQDVLQRLQSWVSGPHVPGE